jgi:hypothetical protein
MSLSVISKKARQYPVLVVSGILFPLTMVLFFMRGPKIALYESELSDLEREWKAIQLNIERSVGIDEDIETVQAGLGEIRDRLIDVENVAANYEFFYEMERRAGVNVRQFSQGIGYNGSNLPIGKDALQHFSVVPYDISLSGNLNEILSFLDLLDRQRFLVRLDLLNLSKPTPGPGVGPDDLNGRLRCHVLAKKND